VKSLSFQAVIIPPLVPSAGEMSKKECFAFELVQRVKFRFLQARDTWMNGRESVPDSIIFFRVS
jgi:hypothetical protein